LVKIDKMQVYLTGFARSSNFPTANAFDDTFGRGTCGSRDCFDAFVAHLDLDTNTLVYSSYLGGTSDEEGWGIAADGSGNAYVTGYTMSADFPAVDAIQEAKGADGLGSVRQLVDNAGGVQMSKAYEPFGEVLNDAGGVATSYGFTGEWTDPTGLIYLRARYYAPYLNQFIQPDPIPPDPYVPADWNRYIYVRDNPVNLTDPSRMWICEGHPACEDWVKNTLNVLSLSGDTGRAIVQFFYRHDERIKITQPYGYTDPSCKPSGLLVEFGEPWPPNTWGTAVFINVLQLKNDPAIIGGPSPTGFGVIVFGHEVSHWAQGWIRFTIQGELLARYLEKELRVDLDRQYGMIMQGEDTETLVSQFNPFYVEHLRKAKDWMITHWSFGYIMFPLPSIGGFDQSWLDRFYVNV
jgi:RHS repeat-associated protein